MKKLLNIILAFLLCFTMLATNARLEVKAEGHEHILANMPFNDGVSDGVTWEAWTRSDALPSNSSVPNHGYYNKYYYLTCDVYLTSRQTFYRSVTIDLNGYSIYKDSNATFVDSALDVSGKWVNPLIITNSKATVDENGFLTSTAGFKNFNATNTSGAVIAASGDATKNEYPNVKLYGINFEGNSNIRTSNDEWMPGAILWRSKQTLTIDTCSFKNNISGSALDDTSTYGAGGAITIKEPGTVTINKTVFDGNKAGQRGSAILIPAGVASVLNINNSKFVNNKIVSSSGAGGTLMLNAGTTTISNTLFDGNINKGNNGTAITAQGSAVVSLNDVSMTNNVNQLNSTYKAALVVIDNANVSVSGNTVITGNTCPDNKQHNVFLRSSGSVYPSLHITSLGANADISVSTLPVPTSNTPYVVVSGSDQSAYIKAENNGYEVIYDGTNTVLVPEISYTVTLNTNGGTINSGDVTSYTRSTGATLPTDLYYRHHAFAGWYDNAELEGDPVTEINAGETGNKVYYAKWVEAHTHDGCGDGIDGVEWIPWTSNNSLPTVSDDIYNKYYYLTCDVYLTSKQTIYRTVTICLNGYSIYEADGSSNTGALIEASGKWTNPLTITNCKATFDEDGFLTSTAGFHNSNATGKEGAVIYGNSPKGENPSVRLFGVNFSNNSNIRSDSNNLMPGAILWNSALTLTIEKCAFESNISGNALDDSSTYGAGGAITVNQAGTVNISDTLFDGNVSGERGGVIFMPANGSLNITGSKFVNNRILYSEGMGGVLYLSSGTTSISDTVFEDNDNGGNHGTAINATNNSVSVSLTDVTIRNNTNSCTRTAYKAAVVAQNGASITVGGKTIITGNTNSAGKEANLFLRVDTIDTQLYTNSLSAGSQIGVGTKATVDADNPFTVVAGKDETAYLTSDDHYLVKYVDGNTVLTTPTEIEDAQANLVLNDNIDANIYLTLEGDYQNYTVSYDWQGQTHTLTLEDSSPIVTVDDIYAFQMADTISVDVKYLGTTIDTIEYSVQDYCEYVIENSSDEDLINLCKATLNYGAAAQTYFNGKSYNNGASVYDTNINNLANSRVDTTLSEASKPLNTKSRVNDLGGIVNKAAYSLVLGSDITMKIYVYTNEELDLEQLTIGCSPAKTLSDVIKESDGKYYVKVSGIKASELSNDFTLTFLYKGESMTITYSPYAFAASKWDNNDSLAALCRSLVTYGEAARNN